MSAFPTAGHLASWAGLAPVARQSGPPPRQAEERPGQRLHQEPVHPGRQRRRQDRTRSSASGSAAWPGSIGPARAKVAVARSILVITWHLLNDPAARYHDLGPDWHDRKTSRDKKIRSHLRGLQSLGIDTSTLNTTAA